MLFADLALLISGFIFLARRGKDRSSIFIWLWLIVSPLPAALSRDNIHGVRALNEVIPLTVILSCGGVFLLEKLKSLKWGKICIIIFAAFYLMSFIYFLDQYFVHAPKHNAKYWQYGHKQMVEAVLPLQNKYKKIVVAQSYAQPYIYFLFYQKYDPLKYQKDAQVVTTSGGFDVGLVNKLNNLDFEVIDWHIARGRQGILFVGSPEQIPPGDSNDPNQFKLINEIKYPNGQTAFRLLEVI